MESLLNFIVDNKVSDICIALVGLFGMTLVVNRFKVLYMDYAIPAEPFMKQILKLVEAGKTEEAITFCNANEKKPLAYIVKRVLEYSDRDERSMEQALDTASSEVAPKLVKGLSKLAMISNVVTLIGLFGTVIGLIVAFKAISVADVSQKQTILAQGISIAMTATAMGLMIAIPIMFFYSFLHDKQTQLFSEIDQATNNLIKTLNNRDYVGFSHDKAYPNHINADKLSSKGGPPAPPSKSKAS